MSVKCGKCRQLIIQYIPPHRSHPSSIWGGIQFKEINTIQVNICYTIDLNKLFEKPNIIFYIILPIEQPFLMLKYSNFSWLVQCFLISLHRKLNFKIKLFSMPRLFVKIDEDFSKKRKFNYLII